MPTFTNPFYTGLESEQSDKTNKQKCPPNGEEEVKLFLLSDDDPT